MVRNIAIVITVALVFVFLSLVVLQVKNKQAVNHVERMLRFESTKSDSAKSDSAKSEHTSQRFTHNMVAGLPIPVQRYFLHAITPGTPLSASVQLDMNGQFRLAQDKPWLPMQAQEILTSDGFVWKAKIGSGVSQFQGADYYFDRAGRMQFSILGLVPIVDVQNADTAQSAIGRLVAELMWLPSALLPQQGVQWNAINDQTIQAQFKVDDKPVVLTFGIDANGRLLESYTLRWGNPTPDDKWDYIPMGGKCYAERTFGGFTIPSKVGAGWWFGSEQYFEFFQGTIEQAEF